MTRTESAKRRIKLLKQGKSNPDLARGMYSEGDNYRRLATKVTKTKKDKIASMENKYKKRH